MLHKEIIRYDSTNIEKIHSSKEIIDINDIDIKRILVANKPNFISIYIVGYKNHNNITTLAIKSLKLKDFVKTFEEAKQMIFILEKKQQQKNEKIIVKYVIKFNFLLEKILTLNKFTKKNI